MNCLSRKKRSGGQKMAERIGADVGDSNPLFVGVLNGAFMFTAELMRQMDAHYEITFARYSSYRGLNTTGVVRDRAGAGRWC